MSLILTQIQHVSLQPATSLVGSYTRVPKKSRCMRGIKGFFTGMNKVFLLSEGAWVHDLDFICVESACLTSGRNAIYLWSG